MLEITISNQFKKDFKKYKTNKSITEEFKLFIDLICNQRKLPQKYKEHALIGNYKNYRECHLKPDILIIYKISKINLTLVRIGSHSELFK